MISGAAKNASPPIAAERKTAKELVWARRTNAPIRASQATELEKEFPAYLVDRWIGNSSKVRQDHYLVVAEDDYREAASRPVGLPGTIPGTSSSRKEPSRLSRKRGLLRKTRERLKQLVPSTGIEPVTSSSGG